MVLTRSQFVHAGLAKVYFGGSSTSIPVALEGKCRRVLYEIENATKPDDPNLPGMGYKKSGAVHSLDVNGTYRINYEWRSGLAADIDYVCKETYLYRLVWRTSGPPLQAVAEWGEDFGVSPILLRQLPIRRPKLPIAIPYAPIDIPLQNQ